MMKNENKNIMNRFMNQWMTKPVLFLGNFSPIGNQPALLAQAQKNQFSLKNYKLEYGDYFGHDIAATNINCLNASWSINKWHAANNIQGIWKAVLPSIKVDNREFVVSEVSGVR